MKMNLPRPVLQCMEALGEGRSPDGFYSALEAGAAALSQEDEEPCS